MFWQRFEEPRRESLIDHFSRFLNAVLDRRSNQNPQPGIAFYAMSKPAGGFKLSKIRVPDDNPGQYFKVQVFAEAGENRDDYTIYCEDREFSTLSDGEQLFERVAQYIVSQCRSGERYPVYITDIDLSNGLTSARASPQTVRYLQYKRGFEERLNKAITRP
jgi:adenylate cyclase class 1